MNSIPPERLLLLHEAAHACAVIAAGGRITELAVCRHPDGSVSSSCTWENCSDPLDELFCLAAGPAQSARFDDNTEPWQDDLDDWREVEATVERAVAEKAMRLADEFVRREFPTISRLATALGRQGRLTHDEVLAAIEAPGRLRESA